MGIYQALTVFFMTGTGNSYTVAAWCAQAAAAAGLHTRLVQIQAGKIPAAVWPQSLLVFTYPTHGFTAPWLVMRYIWQLPDGRHTPVLILPTRAGIRIKGIFVPGLEGTAGYLIALLLKCKGYCIQGVMGVDMPSNWTAFHWGLSRQNAAVIAALAQSKVKSLLQAALAGKRHYDGMVQLFIGMVLLKLSLLYMLLGQFMLAKLFFASEACTGCGLCQAICPKKALKLAGRPKRPYWGYGCDSCMACMNFCPQTAIEVSPVMLAGVYYLAVVPAAAQAIQTVGAGLPEALLPWLGAGVWYGYMLLAVAAAYAVLHTVLGSRLVRSIARLLSHTRYYRRYRAEGVTLQDIHHR